MNFVSVSRSRIWRFTVANTKACRWIRGSGSSLYPPSSLFQQQLRGLSPRANYTEQTAASSAKIVPTFADRGCHVISATDPHSRIFGFLDWSRYYFFHVVPQLYSWGWVDPVPDPLLPRKSGTSGFVARNKLWPLDHKRGLHFDITLPLSSRTLKR
jgi:hypothetical protein